MQRHDGSQGTVWVTYRDGVYDVTRYLEKHPGGKLILRRPVVLYPYSFFFLFFFGGGGGGGALGSLLINPAQKGHALGSYKQLVVRSMGGGSTGPSTTSPRKWRQPYFKQPVVELNHLNVLGGVPKTLWEF